MITDRTLADSEQMQEYLDALGPIRPLLEDEGITEVMVNGPDTVYVERGGKLMLTDVTFRDENHLLATIDTIVTAVGRRIDSQNPIVDARLLDGSRVAASMAPVAIGGPLLTIRKFGRSPLRIEDLVGFGTLSTSAAGFLEACVLSRSNLLISGGTGSGKTTLLNICSDFIPDGERIVTIEDAAELQLRQPHVCSLETKPADLMGRGVVTIRDLMVHSLRMRPDRIVVGECRAGEAFDMLQAMNTGHDGSMTTLHANSPRDALSRLETMVLMAGMDLPVRAIRQQVVAAIDIIVHLTRFRDGSRRLTSIAELTGMEGETISSQEIFRFDAAAVDTKRQLRGVLVPTGIRSAVIDKLQEAGIPLPQGLDELVPGARLLRR
jgi:pilus assembly protein CpaF